MHGTVGRRALSDVRTIGRTHNRAPDSLIYAFGIPAGSLRRALGFTNRLRPDDYLVGGGWKLEVQASGLIELNGFGQVER